MNDFTKEELEELLNWRSNILYTSKPSKETMTKNVNLGNKIASMIINYCEHEWNYNQHDQPLGCVKCGLVI
jgi:hypothetical protein